MPTRQPSDRHPAPADREAAEALLRGRACYERQEWDDAFAALSGADQGMALGAQDLHRLAWAAGLSARDEQMLATQERVRFRSLNDASAIGFMMLLVLPFRLGEFARPFLIAQRSSIRRSAGPTTGGCSSARAAWSPRSWIECCRVPHPTGLRHLGTGATRIR